MGKGSDVRPPSVDKETFNKNWDAIFGNRKKKKETEEKKDDTK